MSTDWQANRDVADPADQLAIEDIIRRERAARDGENWAELAACYTADSLVDISWFTGTGAAFAAASAGMATRMFSFHELGASIVDIRGDRALGNTSCTIHLVGKLDDTEVDVLGYVRSRARVQRVAGKWRMAGLRAVYIHDLIVPLNPARPPRVDAEEIAKYRRSYRALCHMLVRQGLPARDDLPGVDRPDTVAALLAGEEAWLHGAATTYASSGSPK